MKRQGKTQFYRDIYGLWKWRVVTSRGRILADSAGGQIGEGYKTLAKCRAGHNSTYQIFTYGGEEVIR